MKDQGYMVLKQVFSEKECQLIADYTRFQSTLNPNVKKKGDPLAYINRKYGDPLMETLLLKLTPTIEKAVGIALWPTLSFYYVYKKSQLLQKHVDRSSCEYVAGLCIGMDEQYKARHGTWPLMIHSNGEDKPIRLNAGDILIYKGTDTLHWREPFEGEWFISSIFGYVDKNGPYGFQKYDQRKALGKKHIGMFRWSLGCLRHKVLRWFRGLYLQDV